MDRNKKLLSVLLVLTLTAGTVPVITAAETDDFPSGICTEAAYDAVDTRIAFTNGQQYTDAGTVDFTATE